jgi:hypothetical protein
MAFFNQPSAGDKAKLPGDFVKVEKEKTTTVAATNRSRVSLTLTNDSANTIYVFKGDGAVIGKGIRLNKDGGAIVISDYTGLVTAAAAVADSNLCVSEV